MGMIVANVAFAAVHEPQHPVVAISRQAVRKARSRYDGPSLSAVHSVLDELSVSYCNGKAIFIQVSRERGAASTICIGPEVQRTLSGIKPGDFAHLSGGELIWLRWKPRGFAGRTEKGRPLDYPETAETTQLRQQVGTINEALQKASVTLRGEAVRQSTLRPQLRRFFVTPSPTEVRFDLGGRLFGGWWQTLPKARCADLRIDGEPVADLDFSNMFLRLAYLDVGAQPPEGDLYSGVEGLEDPRWREGVKQLTASLLCREGTLRRLPAGMDGKLPSGMTGIAARDAILTKHPLLAPAFESGRGLHLMFRESQILVRALLGLAKRNTPALPMHDGLMVAQSKEREAREELTEASKAVVGMALPISLKSLRK